MAIRRKTARPLGAIAALVAVMTMTTPAADAQTTFSDDPVSFGGVNAEADAVRTIGDQVWVGGSFGIAYDPDGTSYTRTNVAVFNFNTGEVHPHVANTNDSVRAVATDGVGTVWIGGDFTSVNGQTRTRIAAIDARTGQIRPEFDVVVDRPIHALFYEAGALYVGGQFGEIDGVPVRNLARIDAVTGAVDGGFRPDPSDTVRSIDVFGDRVYAAGDFLSVGLPPNETPRTWVAGFDRATGAPAGPDFAIPPPFPGEAEHRWGVRDVQVSPDGTFLYTGDRRNATRQFDRVSGQPIWAEVARGDIQTIATDASTVFIGTHDGYLVTDDDRHLVALNASNGSIDNAFAPVMNRYWGVLDLHIAEGALVAVGDFTTVNGVGAQRVAVFHSPDWDGADPLDPPVPGDVNCDGTSSIADALLIAQYTVGARVAAPACPLGDPASQVFLGQADANGDETITIIDALFVAQCTVGVPNALCP